MSTADRLGVHDHSATGRSASDAGRSAGGEARERSSGTRSRSNPLWLWGRRGVSVALLVAGVVAAYSRRGEIHHAINQIGQPAWGWLLAACVAQGSSMVAFARLQRWLLRCGGVRVRLRDMVEITLAGNALSTSLPGGAAWAAGWIWGQLRRRRVDRTLAGWVVLVAGALASFALFLLTVAGAFLAGSHGPAAPLRWVGLGLVAFGALLAAATVAVVRSARLGRWWAELVADAYPTHDTPTEGDGHDAPGDDVNHRQTDHALWHPVVRAIDGLARRIRIVTPSKLGWLEALGLAFYNWTADLLTLAFVIKTVHASIPWRGIVVSYALTQISASIPITPGGLAVVEASLAALLTGYGMPQGSAITVVLLYRLISFWALVPIGWASWAYLEALGHRGEARRRHPWAEHRHHPPPAPTAAEPAEQLSPPGKQGPERLLRPAPCEGCPEPAPEEATAGKSA